MTPRAYTGGLFAYAHQAKAVCVNIIPMLALRLLFPHTEYTEYTEIIQ